MNSKILTTAVALALATLVGCSRAESPSEVRDDVRDAQSNASENVSEARRDYAETTTDAQSKVADEAHDAGDGPAKERL